MGEQRREEKKAEARDARLRAMKAFGPWAVADTLGYVVVYAEEPRGEIGGFACAEIMNHRRAHQKRRELAAKGFKGLRIAIVRGLVR